MKCVRCGKEITRGIMFWDSEGFMCEDCLLKEPLPQPYVETDHKQKTIYKLYTLEDLIKYIKKFPQYEIEVVAGAKYDFGIEVNNEDKQLIIYTKPSREEIKN